jgi:gamma-glutamyltranspeptidase/glutathione hydrolase
MSAGECSGLVLPETGVFLNNFMGEADIHPLGFHQLAPGTRLTSSMTPLLIEHGDGAITAVGTGGSSRIRTALLQVIRNLVTHGMEPARAVHADRVHYEDDVLYLEAATTLAEVGPALEREGARVGLFHGRNMFFGGAHLASRAPDGRVYGVGDDRRSGAARVLTPS